MLDLPRSSVSADQCNGYIKGVMLAIIEFYGSSLIVNDLFWAMNSVLGSYFK